LEQMQNGKNRRIASIICFAFTHFLVRKRRGLFPFCRQKRIGGVFFYLWALYKKYDELAQADLDRQAEMAEKQSRRGAREVICMLEQT
jgi:hypothetical protein